MMGQATRLVAPGARPRWDKGTSLFLGQVTLLGAADMGLLIGGCCLDRTKSPR